MICFKTKYGNINCLKNDVEFVKSLNNCKIYEEDLIIKNIIPHLKNKDIKIILDIGAHIGSHTMIYSHYFKDADIYCFEPQKVIYDILSKNINENSIKNCKLYNNCVGHKNTDTTMSKYLYDGYDLEVKYNIKNKFNYGGIGLGKNGEKTEMITIDSLNLNKCDYIKLDCEGSEILALMGGVNTIKKLKPIIVFEHTDKCVTNEMKEALNIDFTIPDIKNFLIDLGYNLNYIDANNIIATF